MFGDHALACPRTGLLARRAKVVERAWVRVAREAVGADGQVVPQQRLCNTNAPGVAPDAHGRGAVLRCDAGVAAGPNPVSMLRVAERRKRAAYPELSAGGPQRLLMLGSEVGGRWNDAAQRLVQDLARVRSQRTLPALRAAATSAWE